MTGKAIWLIRPMKGHAGPSVVVRAACLQCAVIAIEQCQDSIESAGIKVKQ